MRLLYASDLTNFFDLSSGEAGAILQKLRTYGVLLAVLSRRFGGFERLFLLLIRPAWLHSNHQ